MNITGKIQDESFSRDSALLRPYKAHRTWVMVIDQHIARLFEKKEKELVPIGNVFPDAKENIEITNKSIGRVSSSAGRSIRHKYEPHMNESRQQRLTFAIQISAWLDKAVYENAFDRIILAASPKTLGDLRKVIKRPVQDRIFAEINKDLTKLDVYALHEMIEKTILF